VCDGGQSERKWSGYSSVSAIASMSAITNFELIIHVLRVPSRIDRFDES